MKVHFPSTQSKDIRVVRVHVKVRDEGYYDLVDADNNVVAQKAEDYVPGFFPGDHFGDYLMLDIDIETGQILNWVAPTEEEIRTAFTINTPKPK